MSIAPRKSGTDRKCACVVQGRRRGLIICEHRLGELLGLLSQGLYAKASSKQAGLRKWCCMRYMHALQKVQPSPSACHLACQLVHSGCKCQHRGLPCLSLFQCYQTRASDCCRALLCRCQGDMPIFWHRILNLASRCLCHWMTHPAPPCIHVSRAHPLHATLAHLLASFERVHRVSGH